MSGPNEIVHQSMRLRIMATLNALPPAEQIEFVRLTQVVRATDGNMGAHLKTLEKAEYIEVTKSFVGRKPQTRIALTQRGRKAFEDHVSYLTDVLGG